MQTIKKKNSDEWGVMMFDGMYTCDIPHLYPDTSSLDSMYTYMKMTAARDGIEFRKFDYSDYEMVKVKVTVIT